MVLCTFGSKSDDDDDDEPTTELLACTTLQLCTCMYILLVENSAMEVTVKGRFINFSH